MNSLSFAFIFAGLLLLVQASTETFSVQTSVLAAEGNEQITFPRSLHENEPELSEVDYNFEGLLQQRDSIPKYENSPCPALTQYDGEPELFKACLIAREHIAIATKEHETLTCLPWTNFFEDVKDVASIRLTARECDNIKRIDCPAVLLKKYRDYYFTETKICITRNYLQICPFVKDENAICARYYDVQVMFKSPKRNAVEERNHDQCENTDQFSMVVSKNQHTKRALGEFCLPSYSSCKNIDPGCTVSGCYSETKMPFKTTVNVYSYKKTRDVAEKNHLSWDTKPCATITWNRGSYFAYSDRLMEKCGCLPLKFDAPEVVCKDSKAVGERAIRIVENTRMDGSVCLNGRDCSSGGCHADLGGNDIFGAGCYDPNPTCFIPTTRITMADNSVKLLRDIVAGDKVISYGGKTGIVVAKSFEKLGVDYTININKGAYFASPDHPFQVPGKSYEKQVFNLESVTGNTAPRNWTEMKVGGQIYQWNSNTQKMEVVAITSLMAGPDKDPSSTVHALTVWDADYTGGYVGEGFLSSVGPDIMQVLVAAGVKQRIVTALDTKLSEAYDKYVAANPGVSQLEFYSNFGKAIKEQVAAKMKTFTYGRYSRQSANWKAAFESVWQSTNEKIFYQSQIIEMWTSVSYFWRLAGTNPSTVLPWIDANLIPLISDALDTVQI